MVVKIGTFGNDLLLGTDNADTLQGSFGNDTLRGYKGNDLLVGGGDNDTLEGGKGDDSLYGDAGDDHLNGGAGVDTAVFNTAGDVEVSLASGVAASNLGDDNRESDWTGGDWGFEAWGDQKANHLDAGYDSPSTFHGRGGNDLLEGGNGDNALYGDGGNDTLIGSGGDDTLVGGAGTDSIEYWDWFATGIVVDLAAGTSAGEGTDTLSEIENVTTGDGNDTIGGNADANVLITGAGNDVAQGLGGNDAVRGGSGNDSLSGGSGNDTLDGGSGFDVLNGGTGIDPMTGFHHADDFVFAPGDSSIGAGFRDVITDFSTVQGDDLDLTAFGGLAFIGQNVFSAPDQVRFIHSGGNTLVQLNTVGKLGHGDGGPAERHRQSGCCRLPPLAHAALAL